MCPFYGGVAQLGERLNGIQEVKSSILSVSTTAYWVIIFFAHFFSGCFLFLVGIMSAQPNKSENQVAQQLTTCDGMHWSQMLQAHLVRHQPRCP